jgi:hypothetical protein
MSEKRQITASQVAIAWEKWEDGIRPSSEIWDELDQIALEFMQQGGWHEHPPIPGGR